MTQCIITINLPEIEAQLKRIADACEILAGVEVNKPSKPQLYWTAHSQEKKGKTMAIKMVGKFTFTAVNPNEGVQTRDFSLSIDGGTPIMTEYPPETLESDEVKLPVGSTVHAELKDVDGDGNESEPAVADFTVTDTVAPSKPGEFGFAASSQVDE